MQPLTDAQVDAMPAGREIDALVATEVMEFAWMKDNRTSNRRILLPTRQRYLVLRPWIVPADGSEREAAYPYEYVPRYSEDIAAAWQVVTRMASDYYIELRADKAGQPQCWFRTPDLTSRFVSMAGVSTVDEMPLAICRACLKAALRKRESKAAQ